MDQFEDDLERLAASGLQSARYYFVYLGVVNIRSHLFSSDEGRAQWAVWTAVAVTLGAGNTGF